MNSKLELLIVDDDTDFVTLMVAFLEHHDFLVNHAFTAKQGLDLIRQQQPDLVISEAFTQKLNGSEFIKSVRQQFPLLPVLFLSTQAEIADRIQGLQAGANCYIGKPFHPDELLAQIHALLRCTKRNLLPTPGSMSPLIATCDINDITLRQQQVLSFVAQGLLNKQIAQEMHLNVRTIESHVSSILRKTGFQNRSELTRWVMENNYWHTPVDPKTMSSSVQEMA